MQSAAFNHSTTSSVDMVLPEQVSHCGTLHGTGALQMMAKAAYGCAARHARTAVIMAKADNIEFVRPVQAGATVEVLARIVFQGHSSMTVIVEILDGKRDPDACISGRFMMVAVDDAGLPVPIRSNETSLAKEARP